MPEQGETWTTTQARAFWNPVRGITPASFRKRMSELGVKAVGREPGNGENLWLVADIRQAKAGLPGQGRGGRRGLDRKSRKRKGQGS